MKKQLETLVKGGTVLYLENKEVSVEELAEAYCVNEEVVYMPDYVMASDGHIMEIRYDRIRLF